MVITMTKSVVPFSLFLIWYNIPQFFIAFYFEKQQSKAQKSRAAMRKKKRGGVLVLERSMVLH